jgi:hypothetical protein
MRRTRSATTLGRPLAAYMSNGGPAIAGRHSRPAQLALQERVERRVGVADNDNDRCASPVHHRHSIWRFFAELAVKADPDG